MDVLISYSENDFLKAKSQIENIAKTYIQDIVNDYLGLNIGSLGASNLQPLFSNPVELIFDKMTAGNLTLNGFKVSKQKAMELIEKPDGYSELLNKISTTMSYFKDRRIDLAGLGLTATTIDKMFSLIENDVVVVNETLLEAMQARCKKYAKSETAKKMLLFANFVIEKCKELDIERIAISDGNGISGTMKEIINSEFNKPLEINIDGILRYNFK